MAFFGSKALTEPSAGMPGNNICANRFQCATAGKLVEFVAYLYADPGTTNPALALYSDNAGSPDQLLSISNSQECDTTPAWYTFPALTEVLLGAGTYYWLATLSPQDFYYYYAFCDPINCQPYKDIGTSTFPQTYPSAGLTYSNAIAARYANYDEVTEESVIQSNANIYGIGTGTIQSNASVYKTATSTINSDAVVCHTETSTIQSDAHIYETETSTIQSDAYIFRDDETSTINSDAEVVYRDTATIQSDASIYKTGTSTVQSDAHIGGTVTSTIQSDAYIFRDDETSTIQSDASIYETETSAIQSNARVYVTFYKEVYTVKSDAHIYKAEIAIINSDASIYKTETSTIQSDAAVRHIETSTIQSSARVYEVFYKEVDTVKSNAHIYKTETATVDSDADIEGVETLTIQSDASIYETGTSTIQSDAEVVYRDTVTIQSDASIYETETSTIQSDGYIVGIETGIIYSNAHIFRDDETSTIQSDVYVVLSRDVVTIQSDADIEGTETSTIQSDAEVVFSGSVTIQSDAYVVLSRDIVIVQSDAIILAPAIDRYHFEYAAPTEVTDEIISSFDAFDIKLKHVCNHKLSDGQFTLNTCPRCLGTGYYYDVKFNEMGRSIEVSLEDKLQQALEKLVLTKENKFHEDIAIDLKKWLGKTPISKIKAIIKYDLVKSLAVLQENRRGMPNLSAYDQIASVDNIEVYENPNSSDTLSYLVEITTVSGDTKKLTGTVTVGE